MVERRCDGRCHNASSGPERCTCWCGGQYHGIGDVEAQRRMVADLGAGAMYSGGRDPREPHEPDTLGPLFTYQHEAHVLRRLRAVFAAAARTMRRAGLMR